MDETQPAARFADFFETNPKLVDEIFARLRALEFAVICERRSAAAEQLIRDMPASSRGWKCIDEADDSHRVLKQSFFEIVALLRRRPRLPPTELNVER